LPIKNTSEHFISSHSYSLKLDSIGSPILQERSWASVTSRQTLESGEWYPFKYDFFVFQAIRSMDPCVTRIARFTYLLTSISYENSVVWPRYLSHAPCRVSFRTSTFELTSSDLVIN